MKTSKNINNNKALFEELSKRLKIKNKKHEKINSEINKYSNKVLPSIDDIFNLKVNKRNNDISVQNCNVEIKESQSKLLKKKSFQNENFGGTFNLNLKNKFYNNILPSNKSNLNLKIENNNNINKTKLVKFPFERQLTQNINYSKINIKTYNNNFINEDKDKYNSLLLKIKKQVKENSFKNIENIEEQKKENSSINTVINDKDNETKEKENIENNDNNKNNDKIEDTERLKDIDINSNKSKSNIPTIEQKITSIENNKKLNNNKSNKEINDNNNDNNNNNNDNNNNDNNNNNINIVTKVDLNEELNKVNEKFDNLYDKINYKILEITQQINILISRINKVVFHKEENIKKIKEIDFYVERKRNIFLDNSGICLPLSSNKSTDETFKNINNNEKENSFNVINKNKNNKNIYNKKLYFNNIKLNKTKLSESRSNSNNIINLIKDNNSNNNYFVRMIDPLSINKIESYLIKKFTD